MEIQDRTFLITGGGSGLGAATAHLLAASGAHLLVADINRDGGESVAAEIGTSQARFVVTDVTEEKSVQNAVDAAFRAFGGLHGAINCAGIAIGEKVLGKDGPHAIASFTKVIQVNLIGSFNVLRLTAAALAQQSASAGGERGVLINTSSVAAFDGQIGQAAYSASKVGIVGMTLPVARDLARYGIRVVTIAPGIFDTPGLGTIPESTRKSLGEQVPFPSRLGRPSEFAALVRHVIENEMLNGEVIRLDGALRSSPR